MVNFGIGPRVSDIGIRIPVEVIVRSGEDNATTWVRGQEIAVQSDYFISAVWQ